MTSEAEKERKRKYYEVNRENEIGRKRKYREANREKIAEQERKYREANREKIAERKRKYREDNREKIAERKRKYREDNREKMAERDRKYHEANRKKIAERKRKYREDNREKKTEWNYRRRAILNGAKLENLSREDIIAHWRANGIRLKCFYCSGGRFRHIDHVIPLSRGGPHILANLLPSCVSCNDSKHVKLPWEWKPEFEYMREMFEHLLPVG